MAEPSSQKPDTTEQIKRKPENLEMKQLDIRNYTKLRKCVKDDGTDVYRVPGKSNEAGEYGNGCA